MLHLITPLARAFLGQSVASTDCQIPLGHPVLDHALKGGLWPGELILIGAEEWDTLHILVWELLRLQKSQSMPMAFLSACEIDRSQKLTTHSPQALWAQPATLEDAVSMMQALLGKKACRCILWDNPALFPLREEEKAPLWSDYSVFHRQFLHEKIGQLLRLAEKGGSNIIILQKIRAQDTKFLRPDFLGYGCRRIIYSLQ